jgi:RNA polymerase sigma factor (sigma-70 family)
MEGAPELETTIQLLAKVRQGDPSARERLMRRYLQPLRRFAHGRLPAYARDLSDTDDLVLLALMKALHHVRRFEPDRQGSFLAYLRLTLLNAIRDEIRRAKRRPRRVEIPETAATLERSPLENAIGAEAVERYEAALRRLPRPQREAVVLRLEFGLSYQEIAEETGAASSDAVRMMTTRALARLSRAMHELREGT